MGKLLTIGALVVLAISAFITQNHILPSKHTFTSLNFFDYTVKDADGKEYPLSQHKGKVMLVMNVASQCGLTSRGYGTATYLWDKYHDKGFEVIGFPCNQFLSQEPWENEEIKKFAQTKFRAQFPILDKVLVNGPDAHPLWEMMKSEAPGFLGLNAIKWNFTKFLIDREGKVVKRYGPTDDTDVIEKDLIQFL